MADNDQYQIPMTKLCTVSGIHLKMWQRRGKLEFEEWGGEMYRVK